MRRGPWNTYYFGRLLREKPQLPIKLFWADEAANGVHVNVSGAGVTTHAPHKAAALEGSRSPRRSRCRGLNLEYPASSAVADPPCWPGARVQAEPDERGQGG